MWLSILVKPIGRGIIVIGLKLATPEPEQRFIFGTSAKGAETQERAHVHMKR